MYNPPHNAAAFQAPNQAPPIHALTDLHPFKQEDAESVDREVALGIVPVREGHSPNPFGPGGRGTGTVYVPGGVVQPLYGLYPPTLTPATVQPNTPNLIKKYNNWNVSYTCGFDVKAKHTLMTCPFNWRKPEHCKSYMRTNTQSYIDHGHNKGTKGIHKMMLPLA